MKFISVCVLITFFTVKIAIALDCRSGFMMPCGLACNLIGDDHDFDDNVTMPSPMTWIDADTGCSGVDPSLRSAAPPTITPLEPVDPCNVSLTDVLMSSNCTVVTYVVSQVRPTLFSERTIISNSVVFRDDDVLARVYFGSEVKEHNRNISIILTPLDMCLLGYCRDCPTRSLYASCQANNFGFWRSVLVIVGVLTLILCLPWLYPLFRVFGCVCCACCCCCRGPCIRRYERRTVVFTEFPESGIMREEEIVNCESEIELDELPISATDGIVMTATESNYKSLTSTSESRNEDMRPMMRGGRSPSATGPKAVYALLIICFVCLSGSALGSGCQGVVTSQSLIPSCVRHNSTHEYCSVRPTVSLTLPTVGSKVCVDLKYNDTKIGSMEILFQSLSVHTSLVKQYWTSSWRLDVQAVRRCRGASGAGCNRYSSPKGCTNCYNQLNPCDQLPGGSIFNYPGESGCMDGPTCSCAAGSGNACQNYRYSFIPQGTIYQVLSPTSTSVIGTFSSSITINETLSRTFTSSAAVMSVPEGTYVFNSLFTSLTPNYDTRSVVTDRAGRSAWLVNAALPQLPSANAIGDIQSGTEQGLISPDRSSFIYASDIVKLTAQCDGLTVTKQQPGMSKLSFYERFPTAWAGMNFTYDPTSGVLRSPYMSPSVATVTFSSNRNFTFISALDVVVPDGLTFTSGGGCFSCTIGSWIAFRVKSVGMKGTCDVSTSVGQILTTTISLDNTAKDFNVTADFGVQRPEGELLISCNGGQVRTSFNITLYDYQTISPNAPADTDWYVGGGPKGGISLKVPWSLNNLFGLGSVFSAFFWAMIAILALVLLFFFILKVASCGAWKSKTIPEKISHIFKGEQKLAPEEVPLTT